MTDRENRSAILRRRWKAVKDPDEDVEYADYFIEFVEVEE